MSFEGYDLERTDTQSAGGRPDTPGYEINASGGINRGAQTDPDAASQKLMQILTNREDLFDFDGRFDKMREEQEKERQREAMRVTCLTEKHLAETERMNRVIEKQMKDMLSMTDKMNSLVKGKMDVQFLLESEQEQRFRLEQEISNERIRVQSLVEELDDAKLKIASLPGLEKENEELRAELKELRDFIEKSMAEKVANIALARINYPV